MTLSPTSWPGGGSTPPTVRGSFLSPSTTNIADGAAAFLSWQDAGLPGGPVLDLTAPTAPVVLESGIYAVTAGVEADTNMTAGGFFFLQLRMDASGDSLIVITQSRQASAGQPVPFCAIACTYYIPAGGSIRVRVQNADGVAARDFSFDNVTVQRIT